MAGLRVLAMVHQADAGPGVFAEAITDVGHRLETWPVAERPEPPADPLAYDAVLCLGGAQHPDQAREHPWLAPEVALLADLLEAEVPLLGVCLGAQLLTLAAGGETRRAAAPEIGWERVELTEAGSEDPILGPLAPAFEAFEWHSYECVPPAAAVRLAGSPGGYLQAFAIGSGHAIQFHAEVTADDAERWIDDYRSDPDAVRIGVDPEALRAETEGKIAAFNELGRGLCRRWIDGAAR